MKIQCFTSSSIGPCPTLNNNFLERDVTTSITWDDGFNFGDNSWFKVFHQCEPPAVLDIIKVLITNHKFYDLILAFDERVIKECSNAKFLTESACSWIDRKSGRASSDPKLYESFGIYNPFGANYTPCDTSKKEFALSFLTSSKGWTPGHQLRQRIYDWLPETMAPADSYAMLRIKKHRSPPRIDDKRTMLEPYQYSIVTENCKHNGYYTEKLVDCFIAKTIPLYWGPDNIVEHFNPEGIIRFDNEDELKSRLNGLRPKLYQELLPAVEDNYQRALKSVYTWDLMENYITQGIYEKKQRLGLA